MRVSGTGYIDCAPRMPAVEEHPSRQVEFDATASDHRTGEVVDAPHYMSPEQAQGQQLDKRSEFHGVEGVGRTTDG